MLKTVKAQLHDTFPLETTRVRDAMSRATPGERYIARCLTMDRSTPARDAWMARQSRAYDAEARKRDEREGKAKAQDALDALSPRDRYIALSSVAYRR